MNPLFKRNVRIRWLERNVKSGTEGFIWRYEKERPKWKKEKFVWNGHFGVTYIAVGVLIGGFMFKEEKNREKIRTYCRDVNRKLNDIFNCNLITFKNNVVCEHQPTHFHPLWRSEEKRPFEKKMENAILFSGSSNPVLSQNIADHLGTILGRVNLKRFADGEVAMQFLESIRGKDVYIIQPTCPPVNENLIELLLMISTCRRASAKKITAVIPYYGYARQDRKLSSRVPISAADVARMIEAMGVDRVVAIDLHSGQIQGFFGPRVPVDNLEAQLIGLDYFTNKELYKPVIVSPDAGGVYRARKFQDGLNYRGIKDCGIAMLIKQRARPNEIEKMDLVGNVYDSDVIIVDDMIDTAGTLCEAAKQLKKHGARRVFAFATHGLFSGPAIDRIENSPLEEVVVTDTVKSNKNIDDCKKITKLSVSILVADAIRRIHQKESLNDLFNLKP